MQEKCLVVNAGSSSLKFSLYLMPDAIEIVNGIVEKIGAQDSSYTLKYDGQKVKKQQVILNHSEAINTILNELLQNNFINSKDEIKCVGHRVVHGGEKYSDSVLITDEVISDIDDLTKFAPLHHPSILKGINGMIEYLPGVCQVSVFDTAFHQTIPEKNYKMAIPQEFYEKYGIRKYGFHGTSCKYITREMQKEMLKDNVNLIICHLGSGASVTCVKDGKSYNTSMGLTPLDGVVMGTRSGSIDPSIIFYMEKELGLSNDEISKILNTQSGLKGLCGKNDFRDVQELADNGDKNARLAIEKFCNSISKYIAQYFIELEGKVDAIVFTAGIGENVSLVREKIVNTIEPLGIKLNKEANNNIASFKKYQSGEISSSDSSISVLVVPTNEEYMILDDTYNIYKMNSLNNGYCKIKR